MVCDLMGTRKLLTAQIQIRHANVMHTRLSPFLAVGHYLYMMCSPVAYCTFIIHRASFQAVCVMATSLELSGISALA